MQASFQFIMNKTECIGSFKLKHCCCNHGHFSHCASPSVNIINIFFFFMLMMRPLTPSQDWSPSVRRLHFPIICIHCLRGSSVREFDLQKQMNLPCPAQQVLYSRTSPPPTHPSAPGRLRRQTELCYVFAGPYTASTKEAVVGWRAPRHPLNPKRQRCKCMVQHVP